MHLSRPTRARLHAASCAVSTSSPTETETLAGSQAAV